MEHTTKIYITLALTLALMISEIVVGYAYNSNTLVADSFHMFSDAISFIVSLIAIKKKPQETNKARKTFGYRRAEQLGAMIHGSLLLGLTFSVGTQAILRLIDPEKIDNPKLALIVGSTGLIVDFTGIALFFQSELKEANMNIRSLFLEKLGDLAGTVVVIITCALSYVYEDQDWVVYVDPIGTLLFCCVLLWATREIFDMVIRILMQDAPRGFDIDGLNNEIENELNVSIDKNNVWQVDSHEIIMSLELTPNAESTGKCRKIENDNLIQRAENIFKKYSEDFQVFNTTIQINDYRPCVNEDTNSTVLEILPPNYGEKNDAFNDL